MSLRDAQMHVTVPLLDGGSIYRDTKDSARAGHHVYEADVRVRGLCVRDAEPQLMAQLRTIDTSSLHSRWPIARGADVKSEIAHAIASINLILSDE